MLNEVDNEKEVMFKDLIEYWAPMTKTECTGIHPCDKNNIDFSHNQPSYEIHDNLFPEPYCGNLANSRIVFLYLNPGFHPADNKVIQCERMKKEFKNNLEQSFLNTDFPFFWLHPELEDHTKDDNPGAYYWNRLFNQKTGSSFLRTMANECYKDIDNVSYKEAEARKWLANNVCDIELFPYHSVRFKRKWTDSPSSEKARKAVFNEITSTIKNSRKKLFVFMRSKKLWIDDCKEREDVIAQGCKEGIVIINKSVQNPSLNPDLDDQCLGKELLRFIISLKEAQEL